MAFPSLSRGSVLNKPSAVQWRVCLVSILCYVVPNWLLSCGQRQGALGDLEPASMCSAMFIEGVRACQARFQML